MQHIIEELKGSLVAAILAGLIIAFAIGTFTAIDDFSIKEWILKFMQTIGGF
ncbi:hypothetical protein LQZ18_17990 [Lachnospiraceae bacterium ZAX-1]